MIENEPNSKIRLRELLLHTRDSTANTLSKIFFARGGPVRQPPGKNTRQWWCRLLKTPTTHSSQGKYHQKHCCPSGKQNSMSSKSNSDIHLTSALKKWMSQKVQHTALGLELKRKSEAHQRKSKEQRKLPNWNFPECTPSSRLPEQILYNNLKYADICVVIRIIFWRFLIF